MAKNTGSLSLSARVRQAPLAPWLLIVFTATGFWLALSDTEELAALQRAVPPGYEYVLYGAESLLLDENSQPLYRIQADSMHRLPGRKQVELRGLRLQNLRPDASSWSLSAPSAFMNEQKRTMLLAGPVEMLYPLGEETARIESADVHVQPDGRTAWTERPSRVQWGGLSISSLGFSTDAQAARLELTSRVRGRLLPPVTGGRAATVPGSAVNGPGPVD